MSIAPETDNSEQASAVPIPAGLEAYLTCIRSGVTPSSDPPGLDRWRAAELRLALANLDRARAQAWVESRSYLVRGGS